MTATTTPSADLALPLLSDNPAVDDRLGFAPMAATLARAAATVQPPFAFGVFGEWGCGKTTLMSLVQAELKSTGAVRTVWFNAWRYDGREVIWNALLQAVFYAMQKEDPLYPGPEFRERVVKAAKNLAGFAVRRFAPLIPGVTADDAAGVLKALAPLDSSDPAFAFFNEFEKTFEALVTEFVGPDGRLALFIDDLDRCLPENAIQVLEAIKLFMGESRTVFFIAAERAIIEEGIKERYKGNPRLEARDYLEKIVQLPFVMRGLAPERALALFQPFLDALGFANDEVMQRLILAGTGANPRRIKRFVNTFQILAAMSAPGRPAPLAGGDAHRLAVVLLIQMRFPHIFDALIRDPGLIERYRRVADLDPGRRDEELRAAEILNRIHTEAAARTFLGGLRDIDLSAAAMEPCVLFAEGERVCWRRTEGDA